MSSMRGTSSDYLRYYDTQFAVYKINKNQNYGNEKLHFSKKRRSSKLIGRSALYKFMSNNVLGPQFTFNYRVKYL